MAQSMNYASGLFPILRAKKSSKIWLDDAFPPKGEAEDKERSANEEISENEEQNEEESEEEAHEDRNYSEDRELKP